MSDHRLHNRRPLSSRDTAPARRLAALLLRTRATPDGISAAGLAAAALAGLALAQIALGGEVLPPAAAFVAAAILIQLRLLANLMDGLVAVEGGRGSPLGPLWNEMPDRVEDTLIIAGFGVAVGAPALGLWTALAAVFTAYVRLLGGAFGQEQSFAGPMAKQHRMAALTVGCLTGAVELALDREPWVSLLVLWVVLAGTLVTAARRTARIARLLKAAA